MLARRLLYNRFMRSKLARDSQWALVKAMRRLTPEERLNAFLEHNRLMTLLYRTGAEQRSGNGRGLHENTRPR